MATSSKLILKNLEYHTLSILSQTTVDIFQNTEYLFQFFESDMIYASLSSSDPHAHIQFEGYRDDVDLMLACHTEVLLSDGGNEHESYIPGNYRLIYQDSTQKIELLFQVLPKNLDLDAVNQMRNVVQSFYQDLYESDSSHQALSTTQFHTKMKFFYDHFAQIEPLINQFLSTGSFQKLPSKESTFDYFASVFKKEMKKPETDPELLDLQILKQEVCFWKDEINQLIKNLQTTLIPMWKSELAYKQRKHQIYQMEMARKNLITSQPYHRFLRQETTNAMKDIQRLKKDLLECEKEDVQLNQWFQHLLALLYGTWFRNIPALENSIPLSTNRILYPLIDYHLQYLSLQDLTQTSAFEFCAKTSTPRLFEYYHLILFIQLLKDIGFHSVGDMKEKFFHINDGIHLDFLNHEGIRCRLHFDQLIERKLAFLTRSDYYSINSVHNRPDIIVGFYQRNEEVPFVSYVIELKWRHQNWIYVKDGETDTMMHVKDYLNLGYYHKEANRIIRGIIHTVFVVFPAEEQRTLPLLGNEIIGMSISTNTALSTSYSYLYFKELFLNFLRQPVTT